jgi:hypothetical protein
MRRLSEHGECPNCDALRKAEPDDDSPLDAAHFHNESLRRDLGLDYDESID